MTVATAEAHQIPIPKASEFQTIIAYAKPVLAGLCQDWLQQPLNGSFVDFVQEKLEQLLEKGYFRYCGNYANYVAFAIGSAAIRYEEGHHTISDLDMKKWMEKDLRQENRWRKAQSF